MSTVMTPTPAQNREVNLNKSIKLPRARYTLRFKTESFEISRNGNPMIVLTPEFVSPDVVTNPADGSNINIAGLELKKQYITLQAKDDDGNVDTKKSQDMFDRYADLRRKLGVPIPDGEGVDIQNPPKVLQGLCFDAVCDGEEFVQRHDPTPEQKAKNQLGSPIKDANGKEIKSYWPYIVDILGPANTDSVAKSNNRPF